MYLQELTVLLGLINIFVPKQLYFGEFPGRLEGLCELPGVHG